MPQLLAAAENAHSAEILEALKPQKQRDGDNNNKIQNRK